MTRIARALSIVPALVALAPSAAMADGLGGLSALRFLAIGGIVFVALLFAGVWAIAISVGRARRERHRRERARAAAAHAATIAPSPAAPTGAPLDTGADVRPDDPIAAAPEQTIEMFPDEPFWLFDPTVPLGLRTLRVVQYALAFPYACAGTLRWMMPAAYHNGHVAEWVQQWVVFCVAFSVLAIVSANAYSRWSEPRGWKLGVAFGWLCVGNSVVGWLWHNVYDGVDPISASLGVVVLLSMQFRYRAWFGCETSRPWVRKLALGLGGVTCGIATLLVMAMALSLLLTGPLQVDQVDARAQLKIVSEAMKDYYDEHGDWPESLGDLPTDVDLTYRWKRIAYDRDEPNVHLDVRIPHGEPGLVYRLTFGLVGFAPETRSLIRRLRPRGETAAAR